MSKFVYDGRTTASSQKATAVASVPTMNPLIRAPQLDRKSAAAPRGYRGRGAMDASVRLVDHQPGPVALDPIPVDLDPEARKLRDRDAAVAVDAGHVVVEVEIQV